jgi:hypothetical protein
MGYCRSESGMREWMSRSRAINSKRSERRPAVEWDRNFLIHGHRSRRPCGSVVSVTQSHPRGRAR